MYMNEGIPFLDKPICLVSPPYDEGFKVVSFFMAVLTPIHLSMAILPYVVMSSIPEWESIWVH